MIAHMFSHHHITHTLSTLYPTAYLPCHLPYRLPYAVRRARYAVAYVLGLRSTVLGSKGYIGKAAERMLDGLNLCALQATA